MATTASAPAALDNLSAPYDHSLLSPDTPVTQRYELNKIDFGQPSPVPVSITAPETIAAVVSMPPPPQTPADKIVSSAAGNDPLATVQATVPTLAHAPAPTSLKPTLFNLTTVDNSFLVGAGGSALDCSGLDPLTADQLTLFGLDSVAPSNEAIDDEPMQAFAKLSFPDGDFFVNTFAVELGRDLNAMRYERKRVKEQRRLKESVAAQATANTVKGEEDRSQNQDQTQAYDPDVDQSILDGPTLLDIPALNPPTLLSPSNVSEAGGIIGTHVYSSEDDSMYSRKSKWKHLASADSSVANSIAPATLHSNSANDFSFTPNLFSEDTSAVDNVQLPFSQQVECPFIPIHPQVGTSMNNISRKHVRIEYSSEKATWELHVLGRNGVWVDGDFYGLEKIVKLNHGSQILVQSILISFSLPDNAQDDTDASVVSDLDSNAFSDIENKSGVKNGHARRNDSQTPSKQGSRQKIRLNLSKRAQASPTKPDQPKEDAKDQSVVKDASHVEQSPVVAKPVEAEQLKPSDGSDVRPTTEQADVFPTTNRPAEPDVLAVAAQDLPIGSVLAGVAPEDMPAKRKGPGRPPKNGVMSKRDEAIIKRKKKELQKLGKEIPPLADLLVMARAEANSTTKKEKGEDGNDEDPRNSADAEGKVEGLTADATGVPRPDNAGSQSRQSEEGSGSKANKTLRSPSPQQPVDAYTEEQLKKPNKTYVILIHEALEKSSTGIMDLQQIYDAIQKMYPYYKYRSQTQGWQSSIRHNLIGSEAFEEAGKIGKGRLWKINASHPIDKEKKRKVATPEPERPSYTGPHYPNGQYPYTNQGFPSYRPSPYGRPYGPPNALPNGARPIPPGGQPNQRPGTYFPPGQPGPTPTTGPGAGPLPGPGQNNASVRPPFVTGQQPVPGPTNTATGGPASNSGPTTAPRPNGQGPPANTVGPQPPRPGPAGPTSAGPQPASVNRGPNQPPFVPGKQGTAPGPVLAHKPGQPTTGPGPNPTYKPGQPSVNPSAKPASTSSDGKGWEVTVEEIMTFKEDYLGQFKGEAQTEAKALFHRAVYRYIHKDKDHGPFKSDEERRVAERIEAIIAKNHKFDRSAPRPATTGAPVNGAAPRPAGVAPAPIAGQPRAPGGPTPVSGRPGVPPMAPGGPNAPRPGPLAAGGTAGVRSGPPAPSTINGAVNRPAPPHPTKPPGAQTNLNRGPQNMPPRSGPGSAPGVGMVSGKPGPPHTGVPAGARTGPASAPGNVAAPAGAAPSAARPMAAPGAQGMRPSVNSAAPQAQVNRGPLPLGSALAGPQVARSGPPVQNSGRPAGPVGPTPSHLQQRPQQPVTRPPQAGPHVQVGAKPPVQVHSRPPGQMPANPPGQTTTQMANPAQKSGVGPTQVSSQAPARAPVPTPGHMPGQTGVQAAAKMAATPMSAGPRGVAPLAGVQGQTSSMGQSRPSVVGSTAVPSQGQSTPIKAPPGTAGSVKASPTPAPAAGQTPAAAPVMARVTARPPSAGTSASKPASTNGAGPTSSAPTASQFTVGSQQESNKRAAEGSPGEPAAKRHKA